MATLDTSMTTINTSECLACDLTQGRAELPGGRIHSTEHWVVEHCTGPLPVGTLIVKPVRHCVGVDALTEAEAAELGPLLRRTAATIRGILRPDQVYVCLWSHAGWKPGHIHFVLQPSWNSAGETHARPGPFLQVDLFEAESCPGRIEVDRFAEQARLRLKKTLDA
jgi:diadenosine tetraphosphate (Ap4A) HIT family hydrolase